MIRFLDLRNHDIGGRFAFFNTVNDRFIDFSGEQVWDTKEDFVVSFALAMRRGELSRLDNMPLERFTALMPDWAEREPTEGECY